MLNKFLEIIVLGLLLSGNAYAKVKSKDITFPGKFYTKEIDVDQLLETISQTN